MIWNKRVDVLCCWRITDANPAVQSVVDSCAACGHAVWRALSSPRCHRVVCMACGVAEYEATPGAKVMPPTKKQILDIQRTFGET